MSIREHSVAIIQQSIALLALLDYVENAAARPTCLERARAWLAWANPFRRHGGQLGATVGSLAPFVAVSAFVSGNRHKRTDNRNKHWWAVGGRRRECSLGSNDNTYYCILPVIRRGTRLRRVITLLGSFVLGVKQLLFHVSLSESTALNSWVGRNKPLTAIGLELWRCRWFAVTH